MMVYALILARHLGPEKYGYFTSGYSITSLLSIFLNWGMDTWLLRKGALLSSPKEWTGFVVRVKSLLLIVWAPIVIIVFSSLPNNTIDPLFFLICTLDIWADSTFATILAGLNLEGKYSRLANLLIISRILRVAGLITLILFKEDLPLIFAFFRSLATISILFIAALCYKPKLNYKPPTPPLSIFKEVIPFGLSDFFVSIYLFIDITLLAILSNKFEVGTYSPSSTIISALFILPNTIYLGILPILTEVINKNENVLNYVKKLLLGFMGLGLLLFLGVAFFAPLIIHTLLGSLYAESGELLRNLSPILLLKSLQFGFITILIADGWQKYRLIPQGIAASLNLILNLLLIPRIGAEGAALVYNLSEFVLFLGYAFLFFKWLKLTTPRKSIRK
jgi:O-antigen/teichoic acid export membrane protein